MEQPLSARLELIFRRALELHGRARAAYLDEACAEDDALRREVEVLLSYAEAQAGFFAQPACERYAAALVEAQPDLLGEGQQLGDYRIKGLLGRGGMGEVYRAWHGRMRRDVALKVLPRHFADAPSRVRRFQREAYAASALNHPGIITIHEIGQAVTADGELHYIVCELIEGKTLRQRMRESALAWPKVVGIAIQVAEALAVAHEAGVVHRDIKPENVMLRARDGRVKVLDFGIAKLEERRGEEVIGRPGEEEVGDATGALLSNSQTLTGLMGTPDYLSPEQARMERVDAGTDIFAFGLMLYELLAGRHPLAGMSNEEKRAELLSDAEMPALSKVRPDIPGALAALVERALKKSRAERYASVTEMLDVLRDLKPASERRADEQAEGARASFRRQAANRLLNQSVARFMMDDRTRLPLAMAWTIWRNSDIRRGRLEKRLLRRTGYSGLRKIGAVLVLVLAVATLAKMQTEWSETILRDGSRAGVRRAAFINQGERLVAVGEDNLIRVWDFATRQLVRDLRDHTGPVVAVAVAPDGRSFATASWDQSVIVWDAATLQPIQTLRDQDAPITGVAFSPDGKYLAATANHPDSRSVLWRVDGWQKCATCH